MPISYDDIMKLAGRRLGCRYGAVRLLRLSDRHVRPASDPESRAAHGHTVRNRFSEWTPVLFLAVHDHAEADRAISTRHRVGAAMIEDETAPMHGTITAYADNQGRSYQFDPPIQVKVGDNIGRLITARIAADRPVGADLPCVGGPRGSLL